ncbi:MAG: ACT domain-containing protein [Candidatus Micrarchaeota archaeon]|nr:ACT domain-containing protein [Candidatus Micrarchaeota archaeon]
MDYYKITELVVITENKPGVLHEISKELSSSGINIESLVAYPNGWSAVFRIITTDVDTAKKKLQRLPFVKRVDTTEVVVARMPDKPGELAKLTDRLRRLNIDLEVIYILSRDGKKTEVAMKASDLTADALLKVLKGG